MLEGERIVAELAERLVPLNSVKDDVLERIHEAAPLRPLRRTGVHHFRAAPIFIEGH